MDAETDRLIKEYLAKGGTIKEVRTGHGRHLPKREFTRRNQLGECRLEQEKLADKLNVTIKPRGLKGERRTL